MYAIRSYYASLTRLSPILPWLFNPTGDCVITSYSIHYTKLYDHAVGYVPRGSVAINTRLAIMELPGMFLTPLGTAYDAASWDDIIADA